jgi:ATP-binding cassette subfamily B multidrug efflux pump
MTQKEVFKFVFVQIRRYSKEIIFGTILLVITNAIGTWIPLKIKDTVDYFVQHDLNMNGKLWLSLLSIAGLALLMAFIRTASRVVLFGVGRQIESDEKQAFYDHLLKLDLSYISSQRIGDLISRATNDIQAIRQMMGFGLLNIINIVWVYSLTLPLMVSLNASLTFWVLVGYIPVFIFVRHLSMKLKTEQEVAQQELGNLSSFIEEDLNGVQVIKAYSQEDREIGRFKKINNDYLKVSTELAQWRGLIWPAMQMAQGISFFVLLLYANKGSLTPGTIAAFLIYIERLVFPTAIMGWLITIFQRGSVSIGRVQEIYKEQPLIVNKTGQELEIKEGKVEAKKLNFAYATSQSILKDLSFQIDGGKFIGIVGVIGSGKSTICQALLRLININANELFVDEQDLTQVTLQSLRREISLVPQETFLFNASIKENIAFSGSYTDAEIEDVAKLAQIHDEIVSFHEGYNTIVGEKGVSLSGGQAQRIALARAILAKPKVLILDDSIASVDNEVGLKILDSVRERFQNLTLILVTHRISALKSADQIYVIDQGSCVGNGKHATLLRSNSTYQKLWKKQQLVSQV